MRSFASLTDHDFELLVADLFGAEEGARYEVFARGPDLGVDLRHEGQEGEWHVVQCKHYLHSTLATLRGDARKETKKLNKLDPKPASYRFVTSRRLTRENKRALKSDLAPYIRRQADVWGEDDIELLLGRHEEVERRHIKLWLPSSAQLHALLASGTYARSRALAEEIVELLPRWVPGQAFFEARDLLRDQRVCVIAGIPGIGKTTLAKMLLADAVDGGFEPIAVSSDIEQAWEVYSPERPQAFYYDDFLGRTALTERLGRNEEDRLLAFMRRVAGSRGTLFILTTREYILQQAHQLYEQLATEGVEGRKFLLELTGYPRLDRARIFYNHAFFSGQLTAAAREALLKHRAYETIIDHKAYNPRQIEWITGLSAHRLTVEDNADYLGFAVAVLDDPKRIWRHGFEHQLDDAQRALLLALASMPDRVEHDDLEGAFEAFCEAAEIPTRQRAFTRALEVLDDSFVRTYHDVGRVFVTVFDPSVDDFLARYLAESPTDAKISVRGAVFFEQMEKLARLLGAPKIPSVQLADDFVEGVTRCFDAPSCSWGGVYYGREATEPTTTRHRVHMERRVDFIGRMRGWGCPYCDEPLRSRIREVYAAETETVRKRWEAGNGEEADALYLLRAMRGRDEGIQRFAQSAKKLLIGGLHYPDAFRRLLELRDLTPDIFEPDEWEELRRSYLLVAEQELTNWTEIGALDELDDIERYADLMGVELDSNELEEVRDRVSERIDEAEDQAAKRAREHHVEEEPAPDSEDEEIEALFTRLADQ